VVVVAAASSAEPNAVMLFSLVIVKVVIFVLLFGPRSCGQHMNHSEVLETQGDSVINRRWRTNGDEVCRRRQMSAGVLR
jgi:hypothetical protein